MVFKNKKVLALVAMVTGFLGAKEIPVAEGKVKFTDDQETKLKDELSEEGLAALVKAFNDELAANTEITGIKAQIQALLDGADLTPEEEDAVTGATTGTGVSPEIKALQTKITGLNDQIQKLVNAAEPDTPLHHVNGALKSAIKHNATHLFASGKEYDAFTARPWNARAAGKTFSAADYSDEVTIQKLNGDAQLYFRENPDELKSLHRDNFGLPAFWPKRLKVDSTVTSGSILTAEITQGRKFSWLPKNKQVIEPEEGKIYPVQIDAEWSGARLQEIEDSWLNFMNKEGSQPEKWSFVRFLVAELMKQARVEDRISTVNGIYVKTPDSITDAKHAGKMINRQNGLFYQLWKARDVTKKYRAFNIGEATTANIYDYLHDEDKGLLSLLPYDVRNTPGLKLYMSKKYWDGYKAKYKELNGTNMDYKGLPEYPENYPNIEVVNLIDHNNGFMFITFADNIEILENIPAEKSAYKFQQILRNLFLMADYKLGVRLIHIGRPVNPDEPEEFKVQSVWSNNVPIFNNDIFAPVFDNKTGIANVDFKNLEVHETWDSDITAFTGLVVGQVIKIKGNTSLVNARNVKNNANNLLTGGDFNLKLGGTLTMYVNENLKLQEISRTTAPEAEPVADVSFDEAVIDANEGVVFKYNGLATMAITGIVGGYENQKITIYGTNTANVNVTLSTTGNLNTGNVILDTAAHYIELVKIESTWYKVKLVNA